MNRSPITFVGPLLAAFIGAGCGAGGPATAATAVEPYDPTIAAAVVSIGVCADASASNPRNQVTVAFDQIAGAVRDFVPASSTADVQINGRTPILGIDIVVREVSSASFANADDELLVGHVPAVEGLAPPPDPNEYQTYATRNSAWRRLDADAEARTPEAAAERDQLLADLAALQVGSGGSEIAGCLTALRDSFPPGVPLAAVLVTDLEQVGAPQIRGDFSNVHVVVAHTCATVDRCDATEAEWRPVFDQMGVASLSFTPVGQLKNQLLTLTEVQR